MALKGEKGARGEGGPEKADDVKWLKQNRKSQKRSASRG
jgi:hypothetical protein